MYVNLDMDLAARAQFLQGSQLLRLLNERATTAKGDERRPGAQGSAARVAGGRRSAPGSAAIGAARSAGPNVTNRPLKYSR